MKKLWDVSTRAFSGFNDAKGRGRLRGLTKLLIFVLIGFYFLKDKTLIKFIFISPAA